MAKLGDEYQNIVGQVVKVLDPRSTVVVGDWIDGPDGRRDMDVSIKGTVNQIPHLALIECKDWRKPVGISAIDALDSKRHDLKADVAMIYSNSGFTRDALRKAQRVGIQAFSALVSDDKRIRVVIGRQWVAKALSVDTWSLHYFFPIEGKFDIPPSLKPNDVLYREMPLVNWLHGISAELLRDHQDQKLIKAVYAFCEPTVFTLAGRSVTLKGIGILMHCSSKWLAQTVQVDTSLGHYDHLRGCVIVPPSQDYVLGPVDSEKWEEVHEGWNDELEPNTFDLRLVLFNPIAKIPDKGIPDISALICEQEVKVL